MFSVRGGERVDAHLHEEILGNPTADKANLVAYRKRLKKQGYDDEFIARATNTPIGKKPPSGGPEVSAIIHRAKALARGGPGSAPWTTRAVSHPRHKPGMIKSSIPGRTDKIPMSVPPGSYILPSDIASALGEGNTLAGEKILGKMFHSGPYSPKANQAFSSKARAKFAGGGSVDQNEEDIPIIAAGGEFVVYPEQVTEIGNGDMKAGHRSLDAFVLKVRKEHIKTLKSLPPPKK